MKGDKKLQSSFLSITNMEVRVRHIDSVLSVPFTNIHFSELPMLIEFIKDSGGIHISAEGNTFPYNDYQLMVEGGEAFVDIYVGE